MRRGIRGRSPNAEGSGVDFRAEDEGAQLKIVARLDAKSGVARPKREFVPENIFRHRAFVGRRSRPADVAGVHAKIKACPGEDRRRRRRGRLGGGKIGRERGPRRDDRRDTGRPEPISHIPSNPSNGARAPLGRSWPHASRRPCPHSLIRARSQRPVSAARRLGVGGHRRFFGRASQIGRASGRVSVSD